LHYLELLSRGYVGIYKLILSTNILKQDQLNANFIRLNLINPTPMQSTPMSSILLTVSFSLRKTVASRTAKRTEVSRKVYTIDIGA
jgi:hypothetical protein